MRRAVIVGGGQAGYTVAVELRRRGWQGQVVLVQEENHLPYQRPPLSKAALTDSGTDVALAPADAYPRHGIDLRTGQAVVAIDRDRCAVELSTGQSLGYDHLVLATGSTARRAAGVGSGIEGLLTLRGISDADMLRRAMERGTSMGIVGGGFIGLEIASAGRKLGLDTVVVEAQPNLMQRVVSRPTSAYFADLHRTAGTVVELSAQSSEIVVDRGRVTGLVTTTGRKYDVDFLLWAVGALPRDELARAAGLEVDRGVLVDSSLRTSDPAISAIGDCAVRKTGDGPGERLESVQNAVDQARYVAARLTGNPGPYATVPWFWSDQCGVRLQIAGVTQGHDETVVVGDRAAGSFSVYCFGGGRFLGAESVGRPADHLAVRRILAARAELRPQEVRADGFTPAAWIRERLDRPARV